MRKLEKSKSMRTTGFRYTIFVAVAMFISGCATQNLADNPLNRAAGVLASALSGVNRTLESGLDSMDKNLMNVHYKAAGAPNEYIMSAALGMRRETAGGPNADTTYRPALASKATVICKGQFRLLDESNPQAIIGAQRVLQENRIEREFFSRTGQGGYGLPEITSYDQALLNSYPEAGLVWHIRCGEGSGWSAPPPPKFDLTTLPAEDRGRVINAIRITGRAVGNVPALSGPLYPQGLLLVPTEISMKDIILRSGAPNPQATVVLWRVIADGLAQSVQRRKIFGAAELREASALSGSSDGRVVIHFTPNELTVMVPGEPTQVVRLDKESYRKRIAPSNTTGLSAEEGMELVIRVVEEAARRAGKASAR